MLLLEWLRNAVCPPGPRTHAPGRSGCCWRDADADVMARRCLQSSSANDVRCSRLTPPLLSPMSSLTLLSECESRSRCHSSSSVSTSGSGWAHQVCRAPAMQAILKHHKQKAPQRRKAVKTQTKGSALATKHTAETVKTQAKASVYVSPVKHLHTTYGMATLLVCCHSLSIPVEMPTGVRGAAD